MAAKGRLGAAYPYRNATIIVMAQENKTSEQGPSFAELAADARALIRRALKASLATMDAATNYPYASLITLGTDPSGTPVFFISGLARHTRNLVKDARASVLVDGTGALGDSLQGARVTLFGRAEQTADEAVGRRFLARHKEAEFYAGFPDFSFWRLNVEGAHYIGGFGRIVDLAPADLLIDMTGTEALIAAEPDILAHMNMNQDHADAIQLYATALVGAAPGLWRMTGIDPQGCDLVCDGQAIRIPFAVLIATPGEARAELVRLTNEARERAANP
jgi:putative heme iron utilization protein